MEDLEDKAVECPRLLECPSEDKAPGSPKVDRSSKCLKVDRKLKCPKMADKAAGNPKLLDEVSEDPKKYYDEDNEEYISFKSVKMKEDCLL